MKRCGAVVLLAGFVSLAGAAPAPEGITIKTKWTGEGDSIVVEKSEKQTVKVKLTDGDGKVLFEKSDDTMTVEAYKETVLKRDGKKPATKLERDYSKAEKKTGDMTEDL